MSNTRNEALKLQDKICNNRDMLFSIVTSFYFTFTPRKVLYFSLAEPPLRCSHDIFSSVCRNIERRDGICCFPSSGLIAVLRDKGDALGKLDVRENEAMR